MIFGAKPGMRVQVWYANQSMPLHGRLGTIQSIAKRNACVDVDHVGPRVIPKGNLRKPPK